MIIHFNEIDMDIMLLETPLFFMVYCQYERISEVEATLTPLNNRPKMLCGKKISKKYISFVRTFSL
jgi:hypothetical protein